MQMIYLYSTRSDDLRGGYNCTKEIFIMPAKKRWIITISGDRTINAVKKDIIQLGFDIDQVLNEIGCITGSAGDNVAKKIRGISGIADISPEGGAIDIGPPDAPVTW